MQPFPQADSDRQARLIQDIADTLHHTDISGKFERFATRRIALILAEIARRPLWFLENASQGTIEPGQDVIDFQGDVDALSAIYAPRRLHRLPLAALTALRQRAAEHGLPNAASTCTHYALESGRRVHLWPAPSEQVNLLVIYQRPIAIEILPEKYLGIVHDGVVGRYGRHWTKLAGEYAGDFVRDYYHALPSIALDGWDVTHLDKPELLDAAASVGVANSSTDTAVDHVVPASLTGIGSAVIYPFEVA